MWCLKVICFKLRFPFGISSAWLPRFMVCFLLLCEFIIKHLILIDCINTPCYNLFQNYSLVHFRVHICCLERSNVAAAHTRDFLGLLQTSNFSCAESNVNELERRILIICIGTALEKFDVWTRSKIYDASSSTTRPSKLYNSHLHSYSDRFSRLRSISNRSNSCTSVNRPTGMFFLGCQKVYPYS